MRDISKQVLSALMFDKINMEVALERGVTPEWFATGGHVFKYLTEVEGVWDKRSSMNVLEAAGLFDKHHEALQMCVETPEWAHDQSEVEQALEVLAGEHARRVLNNDLQLALYRVSDGDDPFDISASLSNLSEALEGVADSGKACTTEDKVEEALKMDRMVAAGGRIGLPFPWVGLQAKTFGIPTRAVTPLAGRDGKGKSRLATFLTEFWVRQGIPILYFPFEDGASRFLSNLSASHGGYDMFHLKRHHIPSDFMPRHEASMERVKQLPVYVEDMPCTAEKLVSLIAKYKRRHGIEGVVIDGLKDVVFSKGDGTTGAENHRDAVINNAAKKYDVSIIPVSHINKIDEDEWISRYKTTGSNNQNKSARMFLVFQDSGLPSNITSKHQYMEGDVVLQVQKASYGSTGYVLLRPELHRGRYVEVERYDG